MEKLTRSSREKAYLWFAIMASNHDLWGKMLPPPPGVHATFARAFREARYSGGMLNMTCCLALAASMVANGEV
jgi:hypothetical protein